MLKSTVPQKKTIFLDSHPNAPPHMVIFNRQKKAGPKTTNKKFNELVQFFFDVQIPVMQSQMAEKDIEIAKNQTEIDEKNAEIAKLKAKYAHVKKENRRLRRRRITDVSQTDPAEMVPNNDAVTEEKFDQIERMLHELEGDDDE